MLTTYAEGALRLHGAQESLSDREDRRHAEMVGAGMFPAPAMPFGTYHWRKQASGNHHEGSGGASISNISDGSRERARPFSSSSFKVFTFHKDEDELLADWAAYHGAIFGPDNIYIIDQVSELQAVQATLVSLRKQVRHPARRQLSANIWFTCGR